MSTTAALLVGLLAAQAAPAPAPAPSFWTHDVAGSFRSLFTQSRSLATGEPSRDSLNRLRLAVAGGRGYTFSYHLEVDSETHLGTRVMQPDFASVRHRQDAAWLDLDHVVVDRTHVYSDLSVYRATMSLRSSTATLTVGRQRIAWGTARFWSPADLFNPIDPLQVEGDIRQGVDAVQLEWAPGGVWRTSAVYAPQRPTRRSSLAARVAATLGGWDVAAFGGRIRGDWVGGGDAAGEWGGAGLRGEVTYTRRGEPGLTNAVRVAAGADYAFRKLYLVGEYFYNQGQLPCGSTAACVASYALAPQAELFTRHRHFASAGATYDLTPLLKVETYAVVDVAGASLFVNPLLRYNVFTNVDVSAGAQLFGGARDGEFVGVPRLLFAQLDVHF